MPVKTTSDLLVIMSNLYTLRTGALEMSPKRAFPTVPLVKLGTHFNKVSRQLITEVVSHGINVKVWLTALPWKYLQASKNN